MVECFRNHKLKWANANRRISGLPLGIKVGDTERNLSNLGFADNALLFASSQRDIARLVQSLATEAGKYGREVKYAKTKIFSN